MRIRFRKKLSSLISKGEDINDANDDELGNLKRIRFSNKKVKIEHEIEKNPMGKSAENIEVVEIGEIFDVSTQTSGSNAERFPNLTEVCTFTVGLLTRKI